MSTLGTKNTPRVLQVLLDFPTQHGYPPSRNEIAEVLHLSPTTVHFHLLALQKAGMIVISPRKPRGIEVLKAPDAEGDPGTAMKQAGSAD